MDLVSHKEKGHFSSEKDCRSYSRVALTKTAEISKGGQDFSFSNLKCNWGIIVGKMKAPFKGDQASEGTSSIQAKKAAGQRNKQAVFLPEGHWVVFWPAGGLKHCARKD